MEIPPQYISKVETTVLDDSLLDKVTRYVSAVMVNYRTPRLTCQAVESFTKYYPDVPLLLIDNGSDKTSVATIQGLANDHPSVVAHLLDTNIYHGPALHLGFTLLSTPYILTLDSDILIKKPGCVETMFSLFQADSRLYALGWLRWVNDNGVASRDGKPRPKLHPYIHPYFALFDRAKYLTLPPFFRDGAPCRVNMVRALQSGYHIQSFPVEDYVEHLIAGTRRMYKGRWDPRPGEDGIGWRKDLKYPI